MSTMWIFISQLLVLILLAWFMRLGMKKAAKHMTWNQRINKWIVVTYLGIILAAVIIYEFIPDKSEISTTKEFQELKNENAEFEEAFLSSKMSELNSKFLVDEWSKELTGDTIDIISSETDFPNAKVYVEWIDSNEQLVEGKVYRTNISMNRINLNKTIPLSKVVWEGDKLTIKEPAEQKFEFYRFSDELAFLSLSENRFETNNLHGETYILLKVPKHINVVDEMGLQLY